MTIEEIIKMPTGNTTFEVKGLIASKKRIPKKNKEDYILIKLQDSTGSIDVPIWDNIEGCDAIVNEKDVFSITGQRGEYDNTPQIIKSKFIKKLCPEDMKEYIPSYDIPLEAYNRFYAILDKWEDQRYLAIVQEVIGLSRTSTTISTEDGQLIYSKYDYQVVDKEKWAKFTSAPAAANHHGNKLGGLFMHTLGVMIAIEDIITNYISCPFFLKAEGEKLNPDKLRFCGLVHDIEKTIEYLYEINIGYNTDMSVDHIILFVARMALANEKCGNLFTKKELSELYLIVLLHHGEWGKYKAGPKDTVPVEAKLLHQADMIDSQIVGTIEG